MRKYILMVTIVTWEDSNGRGAWRTTMQQFGPFEDQGLANDAERDFRKSIKDVEEDMNIFTTTVPIER